MGKDSKDKKDKKETKEVKSEKIVESDDKPKLLATIATPLANHKLQKKIVKMVAACASNKGYVSRGVKEVVKAIRKGNTGVVVLAGDISPIDVVSHLPVLCEDSRIPYVYVPSKAELGAAAGTKRPTSVVLVSGKASDFDKELASEIQALHSV